MSEITIPVNDDCMDAMRKSAEQSHNRSRKSPARPHDYFAEEAEFQRITEYLLTRTQSCTAARPMIYLDRRQISACTPL